MTQTANPRGEGQGQKFHRLPFSLTQEFLFPFLTAPVELVTARHLRDWTQLPTWLCWPGRSRRRLPAAPTPRLPSHFRASPFLFHRGRPFRCGLVIDSCIAQFPDAGCLIPPQPRPTFLFSQTFLAACRRDPGPQGISYPTSLAFQHDYSKGTGRWPLWDGVAGDASCACSCSCELLRREAFGSPCARPHAQSTGASTGCSSASKKSLIALIFGVTNAPDRKQICCLG